MGGAGRLPPAPELGITHHPCLPQGGGKARLLSDHSNILTPAPCPGGGSCWVVTVPMWGDRVQPRAAWCCALAPSWGDTSSRGFWLFYNKTHAWGSVVCSR